MDEPTTVLEPRSIGEALFLLVRRSGLSVTEVASRAGITRQAMYEWDWNGRDAAPSWVSLVAVARVLGPALGTDPGDILAGLERLDRRSSDKGLSLRSPLPHFFGEVR